MQGSCGSCHKFFSKENFTCSGERAKSSQVMTINLSSVLSLIPPSESEEITLQSQKPDSLAQNLHQLNHAFRFYCCLHHEPPSAHSALPSQASPGQK